MQFVVWSQHTCRLTCSSNLSAVAQMFVDESSEVRMPLAKQDCCKQQARNADWSCCTDAHLDLQTEASTSSGLSSISDAPHDKKRAAPAQLLQEQRKLLCVSEAEVDSLC